MENKEGQVEAKQSVEQKDNIPNKPKLAFFLCFISATIYGIGFLISKRIFIMDKNITAFHVMFIRSSVASIVLLGMNLHINKGKIYKAFMFRWDQKLLVAWAIFHITSVSFIVFFCTRLLPIVEVSIFINLGPLITVILGVLILKENITKVEILGAFIAFAGVLLIVLGAKQNQKQEDNPSKTTRSTGSYSLLLYVLLICAPLIVATGNLSLRKLRGLQPLTIPSLTNLFNIVLFGIILLSTRNTSDFKWNEVNKYVWMLLIAAGICTVTCWHIKLIGYKYDKVSRLAPIFYLESVYSFMYDLIIYNVGFHKFAFGGIVLVLAFFILKIVLTVIAPRDEEDDDEQKVESDQKLMANITPEQDANQKE